MFLRQALQTLILRTVKAAISQTLADQPEKTCQSDPCELPKPCHFGVIFALSIESGCFEDVLDGLLTIKAMDFKIREGGLAGRRVVLILSGPGQENAARATNLLIDGHRPEVVISAGFAGGLSPELKRNDIFVADRIISPEGQELTLPATSLLWAAQKNSEKYNFSRGTLLSTNKIVRSPDQRRALFENSGASAVDMESLAVATVCRQRNQPFFSVRVINDTADDTLPSDVEYLLNQKTMPAQWGAALSAICRRPGSAIDFYRLRENALIASLRLAEVLKAWMVFDR